MHQPKDIPFKRYYYKRSRTVELLGGSGVPILRGQRVNWETEKPWTTMGSLKDVVAIKGQYCHWRTTETVGDIMKIGDSKAIVGQLGTL